MASTVSNILQGSTSTTHEEEEECGLELEKIWLLLLLPSSSYAVTTVAVAVAAVGNWGHEHGMPICCCPAASLFQASSMREHWLPQPHSPRLVKRPSPT